MGLVLYCGRIEKDEDRRNIKMIRYNPKSFEEIKKEHLELKIGDTIIARKDLKIGHFKIKKYQRIIIIDDELDIIWISIGDKLWDISCIPFLEEDLDLCHYHNYIFHKTFFTENEYKLYLRKKKIASIIENKSIFP
jgi:hypothetical protein